MNVLNQTSFLQRRLLSGGGRRDRQTFFLSTLAVAISLVVVALSLGAIQGLNSRDHRDDWTRPAQVSKAQAVAMQATSLQFLDDHRVQVVRLAALPGDRVPPAPPGLSTFPKPGQVAWSPALAKLLADRPGLAAGFGVHPDHTASIMNESALAAPNQLIAVVGVRLSEMRAVPDWQDLLVQGYYSPGTPIQDFTGSPAPTDADGRQYVELGKIAGILLVVPVLTLGGAAVRLGARRRAQRYAALRLAGAPAATLWRLLAGEIGRISLFATLIAWPITGLGALLMAHTRVGDLDFHAGDLVLSPLGWLGLLIVATLLLFTSAAATLRASLHSPLAVVGNHTPQQPGWWRLLVAALVMVTFFWVANADQASMALILIVFAAMFSILNLIGPVVGSLLGRLMVHSSRSRGPALLLAGRRILDDPRAVWRQVSGVVLAGFVAGFLALFSVSGPPASVTATNTYEIAVPAGQAKTSINRASEALNKVDQHLQVWSGETTLNWSAHLPEQETLAIKVKLPSDPSQRELDQIKGALLAAFPGSPAMDGQAVLAHDGRFGTDFGLAAFVVMLTSVLVAGAATAITVAASTLDRREVYRRMWQAGTPIAVLDGARRIEALAPLVIGTLLAIGAGLFTAAPLTLKSGGVSLTGAGLLVGTTLLGLATAAAAIRASRPLLIALARS
jgi:hypothetical protein